MTLKNFLPLLKILRIIFTFCCCFLGLTLAAQESESVKVTVTNGELIRCISDSTVQVELIPNPQKTLVSMELYWEEGQAEPVIIEPTDDFKLTHTYSLYELEEECVYDCRSENGFCRRIEVFANYEGGTDTRENNSLLLTYKIPPKPDFEASPGTPCANTTAALTNLTCPSNDESLTFTWDFDNGTTSSETAPGVAFADAGTYRVQLTATSKTCGSKSITKQIRVISPAEPVAFPDRNINSEDGDTYVICGEGSYTTRLIGSESPGATRYTWTGGPGVRIGDSRNDTTSVIFDAPGDYTVTLEVDNGCEQPATQELSFTVVEAQSLDLQEEPDACNALSYTPEPFNEAATYSINGEVVTGFPVELGPAATPYLITAELTNACGELTARDTFFVRSPETVEITSPGADTTLCENDAPLALQTSLPGGSWTVNGQFLGDTFDPAQYVPGSYRLTYTAGDPGCETTAERTIQVEPGPEVDIGSDESICIDEEVLTLTANQPGGDWEGTGITDAAAGSFDPQMAGAGVHEVSYTYTSSSDGCTANATKNITVVDLPALALPDTVSICNASEPVDLTALTNFSVSPEGGQLNWQGPGIADAEAGLLDTEAAGGTGSVLVSVAYTIPPGCRQTGSMAIRIDPLVTAGAPADTTLCSNQGAVELAGTPAGGLWLDDRGQLVSLPFDPGQYESGTFNFTYVVNRGTTCESSAATTVTIVAGDGVSAGDDIYVCETDGSVELPALEGEWSGPGLGPGRMVAITALDTGRYNFILTNNALPPACNSDELTLNVRPLPELDFTPDSTSCAGTPVAMNSQTVAGSYSWDFGDGASSTAESPSHAYDAAGSYNITLQVQTLNPLNGQLVCETEATRPIRIFEPPDFVGFTTDVEEGCTPLTVNFTNQSQGERLSYLWDFGDGRTSTEVAPEGVTFSAGLYDTTYQVRLAVANGCGDEAATLPIRVLALPSAEFATEITGQYCSGEVVEIGHRSIADELFWDFGNGQTYTGVEPPPQQYFTSIDNDTIHLTLVATNQCGRDTANQNLVIVPTDARAAITVADDEPCLGDTVFLRSLSRPVGAPVEWLFPDGTTASGTETFYVFEEAGSQMIRSKVYSCGLDSTELLFQVQPLPELELSVPLETCPGTAVPIDLVTGEVQKAIYLNDSLIGSNDHLTIRLDTLGTVAVAGEVMSPAGCVVRQERTLQVIEGPEAAFSVVDSICAGAPVVLQSDSELAASCLWKTSDGARYDDCLTEHAFRQEGGQSIELIVSNSIGCRDSVERGVFVRPTPRADFSYDLLESCTPARVVFSSLSERENALTWTLPNGETRNEEEFTFQFEAPGRLPVQLIASYDGICFDTALQSVTVFGSPALNLTKLESCTQANGFELQVEAQPAAQISVNGPGYSGAGTRHSGLQPGDYLIFAETAEGCFRDSMTTIPAVQELQVDLPLDTVRIRLGESVALPADINQTNVRIGWTPSEYLDDPDSGAPLATPHQTTDFVIEVTDERGCVVRDTTTVIVDVDREGGVYLPNAFTPDGSGHNDVFRVRSTNPGVIRLSSFRIFDQNGNLVFERKDCDPGDPDCAWDGTFRGKDARPAVYVYQVSIEFVDGEVVTKAGDVTLLR